MICRLELMTSSACTASILRQLTVIAYIKDSQDENGGLVDQQPAYNRMLDSEVALQLDEKVVAERVKR